MGLPAPQCAGPDNFLGYPIWLPPVPQALVDAVGLVAVIAAVCWLARLASSRGEARANGVFNSFVLSHVIVSAVGYLWISDITVGWLVVNVWHNFQYLVFVDRQRRSAPVESAAGPGPNSGSAASSRKRLQAPAMFFLVCSACGALLYVTASHVGERLLWLGLPTILIAHFVLNFHHYLADSIVWKRRLVSHLEPARADH